jgi:DNA mismatch repair protein MutS
VSTPMFEQYRSLKAQQPDALLMFRMGDFFELFFEDAVVAAKVLDLTLTARNRHDPEPVPMAGVPHHASPGYIQRLVDAGFRVAIAEQTEDPAKAKGLVRREIVRVVTPGVALDPAALVGHRANWLAAACRAADGYDLAFLDASTGALRCTTVGQLDVAAAEIARHGPREVLLEPGLNPADFGDSLLDAILSDAGEGAWDAAGARAELTETLGGAALDGAGEVRSAAAVVRYARERLGGRIANVHRLEAYRADAHMVLDEVTRRNLEIHRTMIDRSRKGSLFSLLDRAETSMGSRRLSDWLAFPMLDTAAISARSGSVAALVEAPDVRAALRGALGQVADIERIVARVGQGSGNARDLRALARSLAAVPGVFDAIGRTPPFDRRPVPDRCEALLADIEATLVDEPPAVTTEGGMIREGVNAELDELVRLSLDGLSVLDRLEADERKATGITSLKVRRNRVFGYYIEITTANLHKVPDRFLRKQTLANCERYVTPELEELEQRILGADAKRRELEYELFTALRDRAAAQARLLLALSRELAELDALAALAEVAVRFRWCRPEVRQSVELHLVAARHPMVEAAAEDRFVPNDLALDADERRLVVLTGPNMAGKSTVLRQVALITLLAHVGSFVPAEAALIGLCDRIFTRVGAADDLRRGQSTFMVEMAETASILRNATSRSLVVLDEIGRGTSTYDGLAIAWSVAEDLRDRICCRALFATHYHELTSLADQGPGVGNLQMAVSDTGGEIVFLRRLKEGGASRSYGIQCARLAGLPDAVIERARALLTRFEKEAGGAPKQQLALFGGDAPMEGQPEVEPRADAVRDRLLALDPDAMTPREAHAALYELRALV